MNVKAPAKLICLILLLGALRTASAQMDKAQEVEIRRMLELTGMNKVAGQMIDQMLASIKAGSSGVDEALWNELRSEMKTEDLLEQLLPVYAKYYSTEDIRAINEFYSTPAGQRMLKQMPFAMRDAMVIGQKWGQEAAERAVKKIQAAQQVQPAAPAAKGAN
jgi:hypothetical protein